MPDMRVTLGPSWVVSGVARSDGTVMLVASRELSWAELSSEVDTADVYSGAYTAPLLSVTQVRYRFTADLRRYEVITGADYGAAFESLIRLWAQPPSG